MDYYEVYCFLNIQLFPPFFFALHQIPQFVSEQWEACEQDGMALGTLRIEQHANDSTNVSLKLDDIPLHATIPREYDVKFTFPRAAHSMF